MSTGLVYKAPGFQKALWAPYLFHCSGGVLFVNCFTMEIIAKGLSASIK